MNQSQIPLSETQQESRNAIAIGIITVLIFGGAAFYAAVSNSTAQLWSILPIFFAAIIQIWLSATGRHIIGSIILMTVVALQTVVSPLIESGLGIPNAVGAIALIGSIGFATLPRQHIGRVLMASLLVAIAS